MNIPTTGLTSRPTYEFTLDNGLKVIVREDHRKPEVCSTLAYAIADSYEHPEEWGLSALIFWALFDDYVQERAFAEESGGSSSNWGGEHMSQGFQVPREHLNTALNFQSAIMTKIPGDEVFRHHLEQMILRSKRKSLVASAISFSSELEALIETGSSYYRPPEGIAANLERLTLEQVKQFHKTWCVPNNAVLSVAGDITADEVKRLAEEHFGSIARCDIPNRPFVRGPSAPGYRRITQHLDTEYPMMLIVFNTPSVATTTDYQTVRALQVISALLTHSAPAHLTTVGQNPASMFSNSPRYKRGDARLSFAYYFEGDADEAEAGFWSLLDALKHTPLSQADIEQAIDAVSANRHRYIDDLEGQSHVMSLLVVNGAPWQLLDREVSQLKELTPADIQSAARTFLTRERVSVGHIYPIAEQDAGIDE